MYEIIIFKKLIKIAVFRGEGDNFSDSKNVIEKIK